jgi:hypothetical protein
LTYSIKVYVKLAAPFVPIVLPGVIGLLVGWLLASEPYGPEFFRVAAEIIPILLLALVVDLKAFALDLRPPEELGFFERLGELFDKLTSFTAAMVGLAIVLLGEVVSLMAVANGPPSGRWEQGIILGACFTALAMIGFRGVNITKPRD